MVASSESPLYQPSIQVSTILIFVLATLDELLAGQGREIEHDGFPKPFW
jgi:hypothetical protein